MNDYLADRNRKNLSGMADAFLEWERHCRGWQVWDFAVDLEPPFGPIKQSPQVVIPIQDDARLARGFGRFTGRDQLTIKQPAIASWPAEQKLPASFYRTENLRELEILPSIDLNVSPVLTTQFFLSLSSCRTPIAFELIADSREIVLQMACDAGFAPILKNQLTTFFPAISVSERANYLESLFPSDSSAVIADFGLAKNFVFPLTTFRSFEPDPLTGLVSSLSGLRDGENAVFQILFQRTRWGWTDELQRIAADPAAKEILRAGNQPINDKLSSPFFAASVRLAVRSGSTEECWHTVRNIGANLSQFSNPSGNELIALSNDDLPVNNHFLSLLNRTSYRSGMLINTAELAALAHVPSATIRVEKLRRGTADTKAAPAFAGGGSLVLGVNKSNGETRRVALTVEQRLKHMHVIGATGSGKSSMLIHSMVQDAEQGLGFAAFDPHGDLIDQITERIPDNRLQDVILFDPADEDFPIGFNILSAHSQLEKALLSSDLPSIFRRFSTSWGDVMNSVLANAVLAFLESDRGGSILDLKRFLVEKNFRDEFLRTVRDEEIRYYWQQEFPQIRGKPYAPLLTRLDTFLRSRIVRHVVAQKDNKLDFRRIMDERKILLVRLSHGAVGIENSYLLGSLLVARIYHAALGRQDLRETDRQPFFLYLDEGHNFVTESMNQVLSGARKFGLGLVIAHQQLRQFQTGEADILGSVLSNCYTRICFRLDEDAERMAKGLSFFTAEHLKNLGVGEAICRFEQSRYDFNLETFPLPAIAADVAERRRAAVLEHSRRNYAKPKADVEAENRGRDQILVTGIEPRSTPRAVVQKTDSAHDQTVNHIGESAPDGATSVRTGRGGAHHRDLQQVIQRMGETNGFLAEIEKRVLDGAGSIDVSLESENLKIACEVCVTTLGYETHNAQKCLAAGYDHVLVVVSNPKKLPLIKAKLDAEIPLDQQFRVRALSLMDVLSFLRKLTGFDETKPKTEKPAGQRLDFAEACELLGKSSSTLYRWIREGRVPFYRVGREYEFDRDELLLVGRHDLSGKRKAIVNLSPLTLEKSPSKSKKEQNSRYKKMLKLD